MNKEYNALRVQETKRREKCKRKIVEGGGKKRGGKCRSTAKTGSFLEGGRGTPGESGEEGKELRKKVSVATEGKRRYQRILLSEAEPRKE